MLNNIFKCLQFKYFFYPQGSPEFVEETEDCQFIFEWHTVYVCNVISPDSSGDGNSACHIRHEPAKTNVDLSPLHKKDGYRVPFHGKIYRLNVCGSVCDQSGVCSDTQESYGLASLSQFKWDYGKLKVVYYGGDSCASSLSGKKTSTIYFECDMNAGLGHPEADPLMEDLSCSALFNWKTNATCLETVYATDVSDVPTTTTTTTSTTTVVPFVTTSTVAPESNKTAASSKDDSIAEESHGLPTIVTIFLSLLLIVGVVGGIFYIIRSGMAHRIINRVKVSSATPRYSSRFSAANENANLLTSNQNSRLYNNTAAPLPDEDDDLLAVVS